MWSHLLHVGGEKRKCLSVCVLWIMVIALKAHLSSQTESSVENRQYDG